MSVALRGADWLYIEWANGHKEYYDHRTQPFELNNQYPSLPENDPNGLDRAELRAMIQRLSDCSGAEDCTISAP